MCIGVEIKIFNLQKLFQRFFFINVEKFLLINIFVVSFLSEILIFIIFLNHNTYYVSYDEVIS